MLHLSRMASLTPSLLVPALGRPATAATAATAEFIKQLQTFLPILIAVPATLNPATLAVLAQRAVLLTVLADLNS